MYRDKLNYELNKFVKWEQKTYFLTWKLLEDVAIATAKEMEEQDTDLKITTNSNVWIMQIVCVSTA